jgi:hypothetical protein
VRFFCLPESGFTTGQTLLVDGAHDSYLTETLPVPVNAGASRIRPESQR